MPRSGRSELRHCRLPNRLPFGLLDGKHAFSRLLQRRAECSAARRAKPSVGHYGRDKVGLTQCRVNRTGHTFSSSAAPAAS